MSVAIALLAAVMVAAIIAWMIHVSRDTRLQPRAVPAERPPSADETKAALAVAGGVLGLELGALKVHYFACQCSDQRYGTPGYWTEKQNCTQGAAMPYTPQIGVAWPNGARHSETGFAEACYQFWEMATFGLPDVYHTTERWVSGEAPRRIQACVSALAAAGL